MGGSKEERKKERESQREGEREREREREDEMCVCFSPSLLLRISSGDTGLSFLSDLIPSRILSCRVGGGWAWGFSLRDATCTHIQTYAHTHTNTQTHNQNYDHSQASPITSLS